MVEEVAKQNVMAHNAGNAEQAARWEWVHCSWAGLHSMRAHYIQAQAAACAQGHDLV